MSSAAEGHEVLLNLVICAWCGQRQTRAMSLFERERVFMGPANRATDTVCTTGGMPARQKLEKYRNDFPFSTTVTAGMLLDSISLHQIWYCWRNSQIFSS